jgi:acyl carrier protein
LGAILVKQLKLASSPVLDPDALLSDLGLDSLGMLAFIANLEREFDVSISDLDYEELVTFGDAVALLERLRRD